MIQKEFEERIGEKFVGDYSEVEECYMNTDLDKDLFVSCGLKIQPHLKK